MKQIIKKRTKLGAVFLPELTKQHYSPTSYKQLNQITI